MFLPNLKHLLNLKDQGTLDQMRFNGNSDHLTGIHTEEHFHEMLELEKKRSQRSLRPFLLMFLTLAEGLEESEASDLFQKIAHILHKHTRATDIKGWFKQKETLGIIFTEIRPAAENSIESKIYRKIHVSILKLLNLDQASKVKIAFEAYPATDQNSFSFKLKPPRNAGRTNLAQLDAYREETDHSVLPPLSTDPEPAQHFSTGRADEGKIDRGFTKQVSILFAGDICLITAAAFLGGWLRFGHMIGNAAPQGPTLLAGIFIYPCMLYIFDMYNISRSFRCYDGIARTLSAAILATSLCVLTFYLVPEAYAGRGLLFAQAGILTLSLVGWRFVFSCFCQEAKSRVGTLVVGAGECGLAICRLLNNPLSPYEVRGLLDEDPCNLGKNIENAMVLGTTKHISDVMSQIRARMAIVATPRNGDKDLVREIFQARLRGMEVVEMHNIYERLTGRVPVQYIQDEWFLYADGFYLLSKEYVQKVKRLIDITLSSFILLFASPLLVLTALAIRMDSPGPILYRQDRVGRFGKAFSIIKFRSMFENAEAKGIKWAVKRDPRVTRVGRWIRLLRIDELPQLWNVFKGEMSLIGPRPERPEFVKELDLQIPYYAVRNCVAPGITGWAQVNYPYGASVKDALHKLEYDLYYIKNMSILLDLKIALKTIGVILFRDGAR